MTKTMTDIQAFTRRFESLDGWGIRINGLDGRLVEIDEYDDTNELSTQGHFTYVSHDKTSVTVEVGLPDCDPCKEVTIPFAATGYDVERLLMGAIRECEKAEEALVATPAPKPKQPQEPEWVTEIRKANAERQAANEARAEAERKAEYEKYLAELKQGLADFGLTATKVFVDDDGKPIAEIDGMYFSAGQYSLYVGLPRPDLHASNPEVYGQRVWRKVKDRSEIPDALDSIRSEISIARPVPPPKPKVEVRRLRDNLLPPPTVKYQVIPYLNKDREVVEGGYDKAGEAFNEGFNPFGLMVDGYIIMIKVVSNAVQA